MMKVLVWCSRVGEPERGKPVYRQQNKQIIAHSKQICRIIDMKLKDFANHRWKNVLFEADDVYYQRFTQILTVSSSRP